MLKLFAFCAAVALVAAAKTRYDNYEVLSILPKNPLQQKFVHSLGDDIELDMWKESHVIGDEVHLMVPPHKLDHVKARLTRRGIPFTIYIENVQEGLDEEEARLSKKAKAFSYQDFNTLADIYDEIDNLVATCPAGYDCSIEDLGNTVGGNPLRILRIVQSGGNRRSIWIDSAIHAREWLAPATVFKFIQDVWATSASNPTLLNNYDFYFVPVMNPDGYDYTWTNTRMWRKNREDNAGSACVGTDLNRNYATNWDISGTSRNPCSDTYSGASAGDCIETTLVQNKVDEIGSSLDAFVSVHTYGNYWLHAWGHQVGGSCVIAEDHADLFQVANAAADAAEEEYGTNWLRGNSCATIYPASGLTLEYAKSPGGCKYTYTPELRGGRFDPPNSQIDPSFDEFKAAMEAQMAAIEAIEGRK